MKESSVYLCTVIGFMVLFVFIVVALRPGLRENIDVEANPQHDWVIVHSHADGSASNWLADEKPYMSAQSERVSFTVKGLGLEITLYGDLTIVRVEEDSVQLPGQAPSVGPARHTGPLPMVAMENVLQ